LLSLLSLFCDMRNDDVDDVDEMIDDDEVNDVDEMIDECP